MPWLDTTLPADADLEGDGNIAIQGLKTTLNLLDAVVFDGLGGTYNCINGWPETFVVANVAALPAAGKAGRLAYCQDTNRLYHDTGAAWEAVEAGPGTWWIPLWFGVPYRRSSGHYGGGYSDIGAALRYLQDTGLWSTMSWLANQGVAFLKSAYPTGSTIKFVVVGGSDAGALNVMKLYNNTDGADIAGSELTITVASAKEFVSADLSAALPATVKNFSVKAQVGSLWIDIAAVGLRIERT